MRLIQVGPAHTPGDVIVHVPDAKVVYTGDILFIGGAPLVWTGPVARCIAACDRILDLDLAAIVPGHGPLTDKDGVWVGPRLPRVRRGGGDQAVRGRTERRGRRGVDRPRPVRGDVRAGRIAANVLNVYEELDPGRPRADRLEQFGRIAAFELGETA